MVFGLLPALRASKPDQWATLKDTVGSIAGSGGSLYLRKGLVAAQVALSFLLLFGAGLFVRSLQNLQTTDTGIELDNLITFQLNPALSGYENQQGDNFYRELLDRLGSSPGVKSVATAAVSILAGNEWDSSTSVEGHQAKDGEDMQAFMNALSPGYFKTMGIPIIEGRDFTRVDAKEEPTVAIVNQKFAKHFFGEKSAIGRRLGRGTGPDSKLTIEIIGVVADSLYEGPREGVRRQVFWPNWGRGGVTFYMRTTDASSAAFNLVRSEVKRLDAGMPVYEMKTLQGQLDETLLSDRLIAMLSAGLRPARHAAGLDRPLRRDGVHRRAPPQGARHPAGAWRGAARPRVAGDERSAVAAGDRPGGRHPVGDRARPLRVVAAVRHPARRSVDRRLHRGVVDGGVNGGGNDPGAPREPDRSDPGVAIRIGHRTTTKTQRNFFNTSQHLWYQAFLIPEDKMPWTEPFRSI